MSEGGLKLDRIRRAFQQGTRTLTILDGASMAVAPGELVALVGPSGAGKSTLLHIAGLLEKPDGGEVYVGGEAASHLPDAKRSEIRRRQIGFVYQYHHLLPEFSALENVVIPQMIAGLSRRKAATRGMELLTMVGLKERASHRPGKLSGGEQQRVAIARALANAPAVLLADEPTGNLDPTIAGTVFDMLVQLVRGVGLAALIATHNYELAHRMDRIVRLEDGHLVEGSV